MTPGRKEISVSHEERFYEHYIAPLEKQMIHSIWRILRDADDADDAMQEALARIWKSLDRVKSHPNPKALILKICINSSYDILRKRIRTRRSEALAAVDMKVKIFSRDAADILEEKERKSQIMDAIVSLPRNQAQAIILRIIQNQPYSMVADAIGCTEATARTHVKRGRSRLAELLSHLLPYPGKEATQS
jgi:RNA polymerase sigma-70 factor, ECF subfamily